MDGVRTSLENGDYEKVAIGLLNHSTLSCTFICCVQAADHVHHYLTLDECFVKETTKESEDGIYMLIITCIRNLATCNACCICVHMQSIKLLLVIGYFPKSDQSNLVCQDKLVYYTFPW